MALDGGDDEAVVHLAVAGAEGPVDDLLGELDATSPDDDGLRKQQAAGRWARGYWALAGVMVLGVPITFLGRDQMDHPVLFIEAWMIGWLAVFWLLQTWDRWEDGAPRPEADQTAAPAGAGTVT